MPEILIVDDRPENLQVLQLILRKEGFKVLAATGGELALSIINKRQPALLITDMKMPQMSGLELCKIVKSDPLKKDIPVMFVSAYDDSDSIVEAFAAGGVDYITKPYKPSEIIARVKTQFKLLEGQKLAVKQQISSAISQMVMGIAHEINTPLGTSITSNTFLEEVTKELSVALELGTLTQEGLVAGLEQINHSSVLCSRNLDKVAKFVTLLKSVSQSQRESELQATNLQQLVERLVKNYDSAAVELGFTGVNQDEFICDVNALLEVLGHLIENSMAHAWQLTTGAVKIQFTLTEKHLAVVYSDGGDGLQGIDSQDLLQPFVTTKRGNSGHVGLSANLAANLISGALAGEYRITDNHGLTWHIDIPLPFQ
ncbi:MULTISPECIES: response regulator [unclassified Pseudoalteromonas]|uniref:response regulator n=1 Tax=unclassified Pseudoalteromonas TaxID=194690 RepID=UPI003014CB8F